MNSATATLLRDRRHVWLDSGTTATEVARQLRQRDMTLMPMSLQAVNALTPGELSFRGPMTGSTIRSLRFDTAVLTPCALNLRDGILAHDLDDAAVKRAGLESADRVIVACSGGKWNASAVALVAPLNAVDVLVTDTPFSAEERAQLARHAVEVVIV